METQGEGDGEREERERERFESNVGLLDLWGCEETR